MVFSYRFKVKLSESDDENGLSLTEKKTYTKTETRTEKKLSPCKNLLVRIIKFQMNVLFGGESEKVD
jgi:hypothetical protein